MQGKITTGIWMGVEYSIFPQEKEAQGALFQDILKNIPL